MLTYLVCYLIEANLYDILIAKEGRISVSGTANIKG